MEEWSNDKTALNADLKKIYLLLQGDVASVSNGLDWPRAFGLHLWYKKPNVGQPLRETLSDFSSLSVKPSVLLPPVAQDDDAQGAIRRLSDDVFFRLFELYAVQESTMTPFSASFSSPLRVIDPTGYTRNRFDYHLTWHLQIALSGIQPSID